MAKKQNAILGIGMAHDDSEWRAEDDMRTLLQAAKIKSDPKRFAAAKKAAKKHYEEMESAGLTGKESKASKESKESSHEAGEYSK